jgi:hypothetical protein
MVGFANALLTLQWPSTVSRVIAEPDGVEDNPMANTKALLKKIEALPVDRISEIEDFVEFVAAREQERALARAATATSAPAFAAIWSNPEDDAYDYL